MPVASSPRPRLGMLACITAMAVFATQDGVTKVLVRDYPVAQIVMVRYWLFALFAVAYVARRPGLDAAFAAHKPWLQVVRSVLVVAEIGVFATGLMFLGLAEMHALFATFPLIAVGLAPVVLGERVGWRRWSAVAVGFIGALLIIKPGIAAFHPAALIPLAAASLFAIYQLVTRLVSRHDQFATSFAYMAIIGAAAITPLGVAGWRAPDGHGWLLLAVVSATSITGHLLLVKALELAEASALQPLNYFLLAWASVIGITVFAERPDVWSIAGAVIIVASGLFAVWREQAALKRSPAP